MNWFITLLAQWFGISKQEQQNINAVLPETTAIINILTKASPTIQKLLPLILEMQPYINELIPHIEKAVPEITAIAPDLERLINQIKLGQIKN